MNMRAFVLIAFLVVCSPLPAQTPSPTPTPTLEQRVADLEAYVNNGARGADAPGARNVSSNIPSPARAITRG